MLASLSHLLFPLLCSLLTSRISLLCAFLTSLLFKLSISSSLIHVKKTIHYIQVFLKEESLHPGGKGCGEGREAREAEGESETQEWRGYEGGGGGGEGFPHRLLGRERLTARNRRQLIVLFLR